MQRVTAAAAAVLFETGLMPRVTAGVVGQQAKHLSLSDTELLLLLLG
jgi:hypothetical protein